MYFVLLLVTQRKYFSMSDSSNLHYIVKSIEIYMKTVLVSQYVPASVSALKGICYNILSMHELS